MLQRVRQAGGQGVAPAPRVVGVGVLRAQAHAGVKALDQHDRVASAQARQRGFQFTVQQRLLRGQGAALAVGVLHPVACAEAVDVQRVFHRGLQVMRLL